ncbi:MAG TPA: hypothetical protein DCO90_09020 [Sphingobacterium sp.]|nr:hypothetical protein [Sphingobacterium sp.]
MKRLIYVLFAFASIGAVKAQKLDKKNIEPFTNESVTSTKYETLFSDSKLFLSSSVAFKFSRINNDVSLSIKVIIDDGKDFEVRTDQPFFLKFSNGEVIELYPRENIYSSIGKGAVGLRLSGVPGAEIEYDLSKENVNTILKNELISARLNNSYKTLENLDIKKKNSLLFRKAIELVTR